MKKFILTILIVGSWGTVGAWVKIDSDSTSHPHTLDDTVIYRKVQGMYIEPHGDSLYIKKCRLDTIGWVAEVCQTYFDWESSTPDFGTGCTRTEGDIIYPVADRLVWNRKEKPPEFHWVVRTKQTCWHVLVEE